MNHLAVFLSTIVAHVNRSLFEVATEWSGVKGLDPSSLRCPYPTSSRIGWAPFRNQVVRPAAEIGHSGLAYIDAQIVIERREDFAKRHRSFVRFASESIRGADDLAGFHSAAGQQRAAGARPVVAGPGLFCRSS